MPSPDESFYKKPDEDKSPAILALEQELRVLAVDHKTLHERMRVQMSNPETTIEQIVKMRRVDIDRCIKDVQKLATDINRGDGGREVALTITKLQEAKHWLGEVLKLVGHPLPDEYRDEAK